jgi:hypothetical protein
MSESPDCTQTNYTSSSAFETSEVEFTSESSPEGEKALHAHLHVGDHCLQIHVEQLGF